MAPFSWQDLLNTPTFLINLDRRPDRWESSRRQLEGAGFTDTRRWSAFDGATGNVRESLKPFGIQQLLDREEFLQLPGAQGCAVTQLTLLQHIIDQGYPRACIFEDDIRFSRRWHQLGPAFLKQTPRHFDLLFLGSQIQYDFLPRLHPARRLNRSRQLTRLSQSVWPWPSHRLGDVLRGPLYCLHAFVITRQGCQKLLRFLTTQSAGFYMPDCMMHDAMAGRPHVSTFPLRWYAWSGHRIASLVEERGTNPHWIRRNCGLVYQEESFGTDVQPRPEAAPA
jgi:GR25 family glycosyltransferase involved in LPS biosynthesis